MSFPKQNTWVLISLNLNSVLAEKEKVTYKSGPNVFSRELLPRIISVLPGKFQTFLNLRATSYLFIYSSIYLFIYLFNYLFNSLKNDYM